MKAKTVLAANSRVKRHKMPKDTKCASDWDSAPNPTLGYYGLYNAPQAIAGFGRETRGWDRTARKGTKGSSDKKETDGGRWCRSACNCSIVQQLVV